MSPNPLPPLLSLPFTLSSLHQQLIGLPFADPQGLCLPRGLKPGRKTRGWNLNSLNPLNLPLNEAIKMLDLLISLGLGVIYLAELIRWRLIQLDFFFLCLNLLSVMKVYEVTIPGGTTVMKVAGRWRLCGVGAG